MAGIQWSGGKCHGSAEAKAAMRHNDREQRMKYNHSNPDIDTERTQLNYSFYGKSYAQKVNEYDRLLDRVKCKRKSSGKNATVTLQDLVIYCPEGMMDPNTGEYDYTLVCEWFRCVGEMLARKYGECFLDLDVHFDEVHMYIDPKSGEPVWSRVHGHAALIPAVPELDKNGEFTGEHILNAKRFSSRGSITELNNCVHEMSQTQFNMPYMNGQKYKGKATVEELKHDSAKALAEKEKMILKREAELNKREKECQELILLGRRAKAEQISGDIDEIEMNRSDTNRRLPKY